MHIQPAQMNKSLPIYVATDEKDKDWFAYLREQGYTLLFWKDILSDPAREQHVLDATNDFPVDMRGDVIGFLEQIICARAVIWTGSDGSTFSWAIGAMRRYAPLRVVDWKKLVRAHPGTFGKIYANDGVGSVDEEDVKDKPQVSEEGESEEEVDNAGN